MTFAVGRISKCTLKSNLLVFLFCSPEVGLSYHVKCAGVLVLYPVRTWCQQPSLLTFWLGYNGLARQILPQARIWRSQILARIPRIPWILELDSARILTWMPPKMDYNPGIRGCIQPCSDLRSQITGFIRKWCSLCSLLH